MKSIRLNNIIKVFAFTTYILGILYLLENVLTYEIILQKRNEMGRNLIINNLIIGFVVALNIYSTGQIIISCIKREYYLKQKEIIIIKLISGVIFWGIVGSFLALVPFLNRELKILIFILPTLFTIIRSKLSMDFFKIKITQYIEISLIVAIYIINILPVWSSSGDGFEHYLPYMNEVYLNQNTMPNDLWYHFDLSRNFGLSMIGVIGFGPLSFQIVNSILFILILMILLKVINTIIKIQLLSYVLVVPFAFLIFPKHPFTNEFAPELLRHQFNNIFVITSLMLILILYYKNTQGKRDIEKTLIAMIVFYIGISSIISMVYISIFFMILFIFNIHHESIRRGIYRNLGVMVVGLLTQLTISWLTAGYLVSAFLKPFWEFSNKNEFFSNFGELPFAYFYTQLDLIQPTERIQTSLNNNLFPYMYIMIANNLHNVYKYWIFVLVLLTSLIIDYKKVLNFKSYIKYDQYLFKILVSLILAWIPINLAFGATGSTMRNSVMVYPVVYMLLIVFFQIIYQFIRIQLRLNLNVFIVILVTLNYGPSLFSLMEKRVVGIYSTLKYDDFRNSFVDDNQIGTIKNIDAIESMLNDSVKTYYLGYRPSLVYSAFGRRLISEPSNIVDKNLRLENIFSGNSYLAREELANKGITSFILDSKSKAMPGIGLSKALKNSLFFNIKSCQEDYIHIDIRNESLEPAVTQLYQGLVEAQTSLYFSEIYDYPRLFETIQNGNEINFNNDTILNFKKRLNYIETKYNSEVIDEFDKYLISLLQSNHSIKDQSYEDFLNNLKLEFSSIFMDIYRFQDSRRICDNVEKIKVNILTGVLNWPVDDQKLLYLNPQRLLALFNKSI